MKYGRKSALIRARCSSVLRAQLERAAQARELDLSDILRQACLDYIKNQCPSTKRSASAAMPN